MKKIAIVTGASTGMGRSFTESLLDNVKVDEIWAIARDSENLETLHDVIKVPVKTFDLDLSLEESFNKIKKELEKEKPEVELLVNAAGFGKFEKTTNIAYEDNLGMIKLNCEGVTAMCLTCLPYMTKGSHILNFSSVAAFQPVPYINVYAATKAFVLSFSRSLNQELKKDGIHVMAICPFWTKTKFFDRAVSENTIVKKYVCMYDSMETVKRAWRDMKRGKDVSKYGFIARFQVGLSKILPHKLIMNVWLNQQKLK